MHAIVNIIGAFSSVVDFLTLVLRRVNFKTMFLNGFSIGDLWEILKWHISYLVASIETLFVASPLGFGELHNDIIFCREAAIPEVIKEIATARQHFPIIGCLCLAYQYQATS